MKVIRLTAALLVTSMSGIGAHAATQVPAGSLPAATTIAYYDLYRLSDNRNRETVRIDGDGTKLLTLSNTDVRSLTAPYISSTANPFNIVSASSVLNGVTDFHVSGGSTLSYFVGVAGGTYDMIIPIKYTAKLTATAYATKASNGATLGVGIGDANLYISSPYSGVQQYRSAQCTSSCVGYQPDLDISNTIWMRGNNQLYVQLSARTESSGEGGGTAFADPYFFIDPAFIALNPSLSLQFSPSVGNDPTTSAVPEPTTWTMLLVGFGAVSTGMRRRKKAVQTQLA